MYVRQLGLVTSIAGTTHGRAFRLHGRMARLSKAQACLLGRISRVHPLRIRTLCWHRTTDRGSTGNPARLSLLSNCWLLDAGVFNRELTGGAISLPTLL